METQDKCESCQAPIVWGVTINNKPIPLDAKPSTEGNIMLGLRDGKPPLALYQIKQVLLKLRENGELLYTAHFANCPHAKQWRK